MTNLDSILKKKRYRFTNKGLYSQSCGFSSSHVKMGGVDHEEVDHKAIYLMLSNCGAWEDS